MYKTCNDLPLQMRADMVTLLNARLADAVDLAAQAKQAHWNVRGPNFMALHELFDKVHTAVGDAVDEIAERAVALGGVAHGTVQAAAAGSSLPPYPGPEAAGEAHLPALAAALAAFGAKVRAASNTADEAGDADTADLFTGVSREVDKYLWFVEAHL